MNLLFIYDLARTITEFTWKFTVFKEQIEENDFGFFPTLHSHLVEIGDTLPFVQFIDRLIEKFESRFQDFKKYGLAFQFIKNPFIFDENKTEELSELLEVKKTSLKYDNSLLKEGVQGNIELTEEMWSRLISDHSFLVLHEIIPKFLCLFGSTYVCESTFSSITRRKSKYRSCLSQNSLESEIRCELCKTTPDFHTFIENKECQPSH